MRFIQDNLYPLAAVLLLIMGVASWFGTPVPASPPTSLPAADPWSLPKLMESDIEKSIDAINVRNLWGVVAEEMPGGEAAKEPQWRVLGIARRGNDRFILLAYEGKSVEMLKVGDLLPDGAKVVEIQDTRFYVLTADKKKLAFGIYKHEPAN